MFSILTLVRGSMSDPSFHFHELSFLPEGDNVLVGRPGSAAYAVLPLDGGALLEKMVSGASPGEAADWYEAAYGERVDVADFLESMRGLGFLRETGTAAPRPAPAVGLQRFSRAIFSRAAFAAYVLVVAGWLVTILRHPHLAPAPRHIFFTHYLVLVQLLLLFGQIPLLLLHEGFHVLAGRRLGLASRVGLGTRMYFIVVETRMPDLLAVPRRKRYLPFLAGMLADVLVVSILGLTAFALEGGNRIERLVAGIALALAFPVCVRFAYQFLLFLQTDVYFVITTALGCYDLHSAARTILANRLWRLVGRPDRMRDEERWTPRDRRVAAWYAPLFAVGATVLLVVAITGILPVIRSSVDLAVAAATSGAHGLHFWDATVFITITVAQFGLYVYLLLRSNNRMSSAEPVAVPAHPSL
jgi:hypothetical protein